MKNRIPQNYFIGSLVFHIVIFLLLAISLRDNNQKSFIVFGAHSKKTTKIVFKSHKSKQKKSVHSGPKNIKNSKNKPENKLDNKLDNKLEKKLEKKSGKQSDKKKLDKKPEKKLEKIKEKSDGDDINIGKLSKKQKKQKEQEKKEHQKKEKELKEQKEQKKREQEEREREEELQKKKDTENKQKLATQEEDLLEDFDDQDDESDDQEENEKDEPEEFNFLTLSDQEQAIYHKKIQQEVQKLWRPPLGAPRGTKCVVSFVVGPDGAIESFEIVKRSNMLIYDLSIQRVAMKFKFDKSLWGKKILYRFSTVIA